jgi:hypothetical protein
MTTATVSFGFPGSPVVPLAPKGTVSQITLLRLDVVETNTGKFWAQGLVVDFTPGSPSTATATVTVPQGVAITYTAHAFNEIGVEIFTGGVSTAATEVSIGLQAIDNGSPITAPTMTLSGVVTCPLQGCTATTLVEGSSVAITVNILGTADAIVTLNVNGSDWAPTGKQFVQLDTTGGGTRLLTWTAPAGSGGTTVVKSIQMESGTLGFDYAAVETTVAFNVASTSTATGGFAFGPVIIGLSGHNIGPSAPTGANLLLIVLTEAESALTLDATLTQSTITNTGSGSGTANAGSLVVPGYDVNASGTLDVTATDAGGLSTTNTYFLSAGQYPAPVEF